MPKNTSNQEASAALSGSLDMRQTVPDIAEVTDAGTALAHRKLAGKRARDLAAIRKKRKAMPAKPRR